MDKECEKYWKEERPRMLEAHNTKAKERWGAAFSPDYDWAFFLGAMKTKLENLLYTSTNRERPVLCWSNGVGRKTAGYRHSGGW